MLVRCENLVSWCVDIGIGGPGYNDLSSSTDDSLEAAPAHFAFPNLRHFAGAVANTCLPNVLGAIVHVTQLELRIIDEAAGVLPAVSLRLAELRELEITFAEDFELDADEILALRGLPHLETLRMYGGRGCPLEAPSFTDRECEQLAAGLPQLREWDVESEFGLSSVGYMAFGRHCRELRRLTLYALSDLRALPTRAGGEAPSLPLFPQLQYLQLEEHGGLGEYDEA
jgi:hypothetical protein